VGRENRGFMALLGGEPADRVRLGSDYKSRALGAGTPRSTQDSVPMAFDRETMPVQCCFIETLVPAENGSTGRDMADQTPPASSEALEAELAQLLVSSLNLEMAPDEIDPAEPLYGEGLGLDSIDILELALVISKRYGFQLRSDNEDNIRIFSSLRALAAHIATHRTK